MTVSVANASEEAEANVTYTILEGHDAGRVVVEVSSDSGSYTYVVASAPISV